MSIQVHSIRTATSVAHLVITELGMVLVDAGGPGSPRALLRALRKHGRGELKSIFITHAHYDHYGNAAVLRCETGAPIAVHRADAEAMARGETLVTSAHGLGRPMLALAMATGGLGWADPTPPDLVLDDGDGLEGLGVDATVLHTPGHTDGSCCLIVDGRLAFVGDLLSGPFPTRLQSVFAVDWAQLPASLRRLQAAQPEWVYLGHGRRPVPGSRIQRLAPDARR